MKENVGKTLILDDEKRKRGTSDIVWTTIWLFFSIVWNSFLIVQAIIAEDFWNSPAKDIVAIILASNIPNIVFLGGLITMLKKTEYVRTIEFLIHSYERWNFDDKKYETLYLTERVSLHANYIYFWHKGDILDKMNQRELQERCENLPDEYCSFIGYKSKEEAMKSIIEKIKYMVSIDQEKVHVKVRNVSTVEVFTLQELKDRFESGEFDKLIDNKK